MIGFKPLVGNERIDLELALKANAESEGRVPIHMDPKDTTFRPVNRIAALLGHSTPADEVAGEETINAIKSVPCHY